MSISSELAFNGIGMAFCGALYVLCSVSSFCIHRARERSLLAGFGGPNDSDRQGPLLRSSQRILGNAEFFYMSTQLGLLLAALLMGVFLARALLGTLSGGTAQLHGLHFSLVELAVMALVVLGAVVCAQVLKAYANSHLETVFGLISIPLILISGILGPISILARRIVKWILKMSNIPEALDRELGVTTDDLLRILERSSFEGKIPSEQHELIEGVIASAETLVREVMTPRSQIVSVSRDATLTEVLTVLSAEKISRVLVVGDTLDSVMGVLLAKDLLPLVGKAVSEFTVENFLRPVHVVPSVLRVDRLLRELRAKGAHLAVVVDEHGGVDGIVTVEDLLEEIVGEIFDEHDKPSEELAVQRLPNGDFLVDAATSVTSLALDYGISFPEGEYETLAGLIMQTLGRLPVKGEQVEIGNFKLRIEKVASNRILAARILRTNRVSLLEKKEPGTISGALEAAPRLGISGK